MEDDNCPQCGLMLDAAQDNEYRDVCGCQIILCPACAEREGLL